MSGRVGRSGMLFDQRQQPGQIADATGFQAEYLPLAILTPSDQVVGVGGDAGKEPAFGQPAAEPGDAPEPGIAKR